LTLDDRSNRDIRRGTHRVNTKMEGGRQSYRLTMRDDLVSNLYKVTSPSTPGGRKTAIGGGGTSPSDLTASTANTSPSETTACGDSQSASLTPTTDPSLSCGSQAVTTPLGHSLSDLCPTTHSLSDLCPTTPVSGQSECSPASAMSRSSSASGAHIDHTAFMLGLQDEFRRDEDSGSDDEREWNACFSPSASADALEGDGQRRGAPEEDSSVREGEHTKVESVTMTASLQLDIDGASPETGLGVCISPSRNLSSSTVDLFRETSKREGGRIVASDHPSLPQEATIRRQLSPRPAAYEKSSAPAIPSFGSPGTGQFDIGSPSGLGPFKVTSPQGLELFEVGSPPGHGLFEVGSPLEVGGFSPRPGLQSSPKLGPKRSATLPTIGLGSPRPGLHSSPKLGPKRSATLPTIYSPQELQEELESVRQKQQQQRSASGSSRQKPALLKMRPSLVARSHSASSAAKSRMLGLKEKASRKFSSRRSAGHVSAPVSRQGSVDSVGKAPLSSSHSIGRATLSSSLTKNDAWSFDSGLEIPAARPLDSSEDMTTISQVSLTSSSGFVTRAFGRSASNPIDGSRRRLATAISNRTTRARDRTVSALLTAAGPAVATGNPHRRAIDRANRAQMTETGCLSPTGDELDSVMSSECGEARSTGPLLSKARPGLVRRISSLTSSRRLGSGSKEDTVSRKDDKTHCSAHDGEGVSMQRPFRPRTRHESLDDFASVIASIGSPNSFAAAEGSQHSHPGVSSVPSNLGTTAGSEREGSGGGGSAVISAIDSAGFLISPTPSAEMLSPGCGGATSSRDADLLFLSPLSNGDMFDLDYGLPELLTGASAIDRRLVMEAYPETRGFFRRRKLGDGGGGLEVPLTTTLSEEKKERKEGKRAVRLRLAPRVSRSLNRVGLTGKDKAGNGVSKFRR